MAQKLAGILLLMSFSGLMACTPPPPTEYAIDFLDTTGVFVKNTVIEPKSIEGSVVNFMIPCTDTFDFRFVMTQQKGRFWGEENTGVFTFRLPEIKECPEPKEFLVRLDVADLGRRISEQHQIPMPTKMTVNGQKIDLRKEAP